MVICVVSVTVFYGCLPQVTVVLVTWAKETAAGGDGAKAEAEKLQGGDSARLECTAVVEVQGSSEARACDLIQGLIRLVQSGSSSALSGYRRLKLATRLELRPPLDDSSIPPSAPAAPDEQAQTRVRNASVPPAPVSAVSTGQPPAPALPQTAASTGPPASQPATAKPAASTRTAGPSNLNRDMHQVLDFFNPVSFVRNQGGQQ
jgi:hypothetical protein